MLVETHIIVAQSFTLLILLLVMWKDRNERRKNGKLLEKQINQLENSVSTLLNNNERREDEKLLKKQISQLENSVKALPQDNQKEINFLANAARQVDELQEEIVRLEGRRLIAFSNSPPEISVHNPYWRDLSFWMRAKKQWTCENEECRINLKDRPSDLHVHHIRGRGYNSPQHLKVLCRACHAEEPGHAFMKAYPEYKAFLKWKSKI